MDTEAFLKMLHEQNTAIAAAEEPKEKGPVGLDPIRVQREEERRKKFGTFRARSDDKLWGKPNE